MYNGYYEGKTVLVTGVAGFKGAWWTICLLSAGAKEVIGLEKARGAFWALDPSSIVVNPFAPDATRRGVTVALS